MNGHFINLHRFFATLLCFSFLLSANAWSQEEKEPQQDQPDTPEVANTTPFQLPSELADGRPIRAVGIYHSQLAELVPGTFQPMSADVLREAVESSKKQIPDDGVVQIRDSLYVVELVRNSLVSSRSEIEIQSDSQSTTICPLGKVNLAIEPGSLSSSSLMTSSSSDETDASIGSDLNKQIEESIPRFQTMSDGSLAAVVSGDQTLSFAWTLQSESKGTVKQFDVRLPPSPQTRMVIKVPSEVTIESQDGVVRLSPSPPPEFDELSRSADSRYFVIDAGGLSRIRLRARSSPKSPVETGDDTTAFGSTPLLVRNTYAEYEIDPSVLSWTYRVGLQLSNGSVIPPLLVTGSKVISVHVNSVATPFTATAISKNKTRIEIQGNYDTTSILKTPTSITLSGQTLWRDASGWCDLPIPYFQTPWIISSEVNSRVQLTTTEPLRLP